jgi:uncharacterized protein YqjF (DUF2071 family)
MTSTLPSPRDDSAVPTTPAHVAAGWPAMRHRWAHLLFLHWPVAADELRRLVPPELDVDTFEGQAYVGLVPFTMTGVRPVWSPPVRGLSSFHEVNVRTYVHRYGEDPGVWFFSLDAANRFAVAVGRTFWKLPYHFARMGLIRDGNGIFYRSERLWPGPSPASCSLRYEPKGTPGGARAGTLEQFLIERYVLYTRRGSRLWMGRVHHAPYPLQGAEVHELSEDLIAAAGILVPDQPPLAHYAEEVRVRVYGLRSVAGRGR